MGLFDQNKSQKNRKSDFSSTIKLFSEPVFVFKVFARSIMIILAVFLSFLLIIAIHSYQLEGLYSCLFFLCVSCFLALLLRMFIFVPQINYFSFRHYFMFVFLICISISLFILCILPKWITTTENMDLLILYGIMIFILSIGSLNALFFSDTTHYLINTKSRELIIRCTSLFLLASGEKRFKFKVIEKGILKQTGWEGMEYQITLTTSMNEQIRFSDLNKATAIVTTLYLIKHLKVPIAFGNEIFTPRIFERNTQPPQLKPEVQSNNENLIDIGWEEISVNPLIIQKREISTRYRLINDIYESKLAAFILFVITIFLPISTGLLILSLPTDVKILSPILFSIAIFSFIIYLGLTSKELLMINENGVFIGEKIIGIPVWWSSLPFFSFHKLKLQEVESKFHILIDTFFISIEITKFESERKAKVFFNFLNQFLIDYK